MKYTLRMTGEQHTRLQKHLFPGDRLEAAALLLCGRRNGNDRHVFCTREIVLIPHDACQRTAASVDWPTKFADPLIQQAMKRGFAIVKVHSHPGGLERFSERDDHSDASFFNSVNTWLEDEAPHASAVMLPGSEGRVFARAVASDGAMSPIDLITVCGDDLQYWFSGGSGYHLPDFVLRHAQAFGAGTIERLRRLTIAIVGCSGTGGPLIEQLVRLGVGCLLLVDHDRVEWRNLNRINMTTASDANLRRPKVEVLADAIGRIGLGTRVIPLAADLATPEAVQAVASCDIVFGCMDSWAGRDILNRLATFYVLPYLDLGVDLKPLEPLETGGIDTIWGAVHYVQPGRSSLKSRGVYTSEDVRAELLRRADPNEYQRRLKEKYIRGAQEESPAVISVNTLVAAMAVNEFLARIHPYRLVPNEEFAAQRIALHEGYTFRDAESSLTPCPLISKDVGRGDVIPLLDRPELSEEDAT